MLFGEAVDVTLWSHMHGAPRFIQRHLTECTFVPERMRKCTQKFPVKEEIFVEAVPTLPAFVFISAQEL